MTMIKACVLPSIHSRNAYPYSRASTKDTDPASASAAAAAKTFVQRDRSKSDSTGANATVSVQMLHASIPSKRQQQPLLQRAAADVADFCDDVINNDSSANDEDTCTANPVKRVNEAGNSNLRRTASTPTLVQKGKLMKMPHIVQAKVTSKTQHIRTTYSNNNTNSPLTKKAPSLPRVNSNASKSTSKTNEKSDRDKKITATVTTTHATKSSRRESGDSGLGMNINNSKGGGGGGGGLLRQKPTVADKCRKTTTTGLGPTGANASDERAETDSINSADAADGCYGNAAGHQCPLEAERYDRIVRWLSEVAASGNQTYLPCDYIQTDTAIHIVWTE